MLFDRGGVARLPRAMTLADDRREVCDVAVRAGGHERPELSVGEGAKDPAPGSLGNDGPDEVGQRGSGQQPDYDAHDPEAKQAHPKTPSDMGNR